MNMLKENFKNSILLFGALLPFLLIIIFFARVILPRIIIPIPQYEILFSIKSSQYSCFQGDYFISDFFVKNETLRAIVRKPKNNQDSKECPSSLTLLAYNVALKTNKEIPINIENWKDLPDESEVIVPLKESSKIDPDFRAPDQYVYINSSLREKEPFLAFLMNYNPKLNSHLINGFAVYQIPDPLLTITIIPFYPVGKERIYHFIGWIIKNEN